MIKHKRSDVILFHLQIVSTAKSLCISLKHLRRENNVAFHSSSQKRKGVTILTKLWMQICRIFLGVMFLVAGVNGYFVILGLDPFIATSPDAMALFEFEYLLIIEKSLEVICGVLLLIHQFIPLVLTILSPITANIFLLHLFLDPSLLALAIVLVLCHGYLLYYYKDNFIAILERKPKSS